MKSIIKFILCCFGIHDWNIERSTQYHDRWENHSTRIGLDSVDLGGFYFDGKCNICGKQTQKLTQKIEEFKKSKEKENKDFKEYVERKRIVKEKIQKEIKALSKQCELRWKKD